MFRGALSMLLSKLQCTIINCCRIAAYSVLVVGMSSVHSKEPEGSVQKYVQEGKELRNNQIELGPGVYKFDRIVLEGLHATLRGAGRGVTTVYLKEGVVASYPEPVVENISLVGDGSGIGIRFTNTWSGHIERVEVENFRESVRIELTDEGREMAGGATLNGWPSAGSKAKHWGSRVTLTSIRDLEATGKGDGVVLRNFLKNSRKGRYYSPTQDKRAGEFFTATTIWGGHIYVQGRALDIGDGVATTKVIGSYIDIGLGGGIFMDYGARNLTLIGVSLDLSAKRREAGASILTIPKRSKDSVRIVGMGLKSEDITVTDFKLKSLKGVQQ